MDKITLHCINIKCPRKRKILRPKDVGENVVDLYSYCPWHDDSGWKTYPEFFYDKEGRQLDPFTWKPLKKINYANSWVRNNFK